MCNEVLLQQWNNLAALLHKETNLTFDLYGSLISFSTESLTRAIMSGQEGVYISLPPARSYEPVII